MIQNKPQDITARSFRAVSGAISMILIFLFSFNESRGESERESLAKDHPRPSYDDVKDIEAMALALRESKPAIQRGAWEWDRLLSRYLDGGRKEKNVIVILQAYFRSILDREGKGDRYKSFFYGHGAWGSGGRLRIYQELVRQKMLTAEEQALFREIISESLKSSFDYSMSERSANNRPYGVNGGTAIALQMFPDLPQAKSHRRWLDAQWLELAEYGDTTETNYYPYGPIYLDGLLDMAEGMGKFETERQFLHAHVSRYLDYVHGGGVRPADGPRRPARPQEDPQGHQEGGVLQRHRRRGRGDGPGAPVPGRPARRRRQVPHREDPRVHRRGGHGVGRPERQREDLGGSCVLTGPEM